MSEQRNFSTISHIPIDSLKPFSKHPFKLYEGKRFLEMVESVKENGVLSPIIVRQISPENYEILSGHNRTEAAKSAGFATIPAIIRENLTEEEIMLIVTETNLIQRSFSDLSHSERAVTLATRHEALKKQGKRSDLIKEIESMLNNNDSKNTETSHHIDEKLYTDKKLAKDYDLSSRNVSRYIRINKLIDSLKKKLDDNKIPFLAAIELSYISEEEQNNLNNVLDSDFDIRLDVKKASIIREFSKNNPLSIAEIEDILAGRSGKKRNRTIKPVAFKIKSKIMSKYFEPGYKDNEVEDEIITALEFYRAHKNSEMHSL